MNRYFIRRILETIPLMLAHFHLCIHVYSLDSGRPGENDCGLDAEESEVQAIREEYDLDKPLVIQHVKYMGKLFHGNMGQSMKSGTPVTELILTRMKTTLKLVFAGILWAPALGIFIGVISAIKRGKALDHACMFLAISGLSAPGFWLGLMGIQIFSVQLGWLPSGGLDSWKGMVPRPLRWDAASWQYLARYSRSSMLETLREDYVRTARAKGQKESLVMFLHAFRNSPDPGRYDPGTSDRWTLIRFRSYRNSFLYSRNGPSSCRFYCIP